MSLLNHLAAADRERLFADWGTPAMLLSVQQFYDPAGGLIAASAQETAVTVVAGHMYSVRSKVTTAGLKEIDTSFLLRLADVPPDAVWSNLQLVIDGICYRIIETTANRLDETILLSCKRV